MTAELAIAVDVGGTKVAAALVDRSGEVHHRVQENLCREGGEAAVAQVVRIADTIAGGSGASGVGVAVPAVVDAARREVVWAPNIRDWSHVPLAQAIEHQVGLPVWLEYDGHAATLGEHWMGAGRGMRNMFVLIVGTGIGGGMVLDGRLYRGSDGLAGAAGWLTSGSAACPPALELAAAGPAVAALGGASRGHAEEVFEAAAAGDELAQHALEATADRIGLGVADVVSLINPDVVVLGGGVFASPQAERLLPRIRTMMRKHAQPMSAKRAQVLRTQLGADAGLIGAASSVFSELLSDLSELRSRRY